MTVSLWFKKTFQVKLPGQFIISLICIYLISLVINYLSCCTNSVWFFHMFWSQRSLQGVPHCFLVKAVWLSFITLQLCSSWQFYCRNTETFHYNKTKQNRRWVTVRLGLCCFHWTTSWRKTLKWSIGWSTRTRRNKQ